ncbi:MAG: ABC transporter substrate-binding protein [Zoogloeaceae bacterium]|jgi:ABC-type nitrate/sulfonate/bicarbonate transport system substrate-binding protein|nr:ABC transporter substrate-binding protein [Zoogloeaceae bacterium]
MSEHLETLWYTRCPVPTGLGIAVQKGWLEEGLRGQCAQIKSLRESSDRAVRESHFDHTLENSVRHGGSIPAIWARSAGRDTRLVGLSWADETQRILALPQSGIQSVKDLKGRRFGLPKWENVQIDFPRAQALRALESALKLQGLALSDVELVDFPIGGGFSDGGPARDVNGSYVFGASRSGRNTELVGLLREEVDAIFLKGASAAQTAHQFGLHTVIDVGAHPDPLIRSNNGTPRTLTVDRNLIDHHFDATTHILGAVLRAEDWARQHPDETRRFLARETNSSEYWVSVAYGEEAHLHLDTNFSEVSVRALQDFSDFLHRQHFIPEAVNVAAWIDTRPYATAAQAQSRLAA